MATFQGKEGLIGIDTALVASSCCLLPLGLMGLGVSYYLYFRERRRCKTDACAMVGKTFNMVTLTLATLIMLGVIWADFFAVLVDGGDMQPDVIVYSSSW